MSEKTKRKISESLKGRDVWNKGIPCSEEKKRKISETRKEGFRTGRIKHWNDGRGKGWNWYGYKMLNLKGCKKKQILEHHLVWMQHNLMLVPEGSVIHHRDMDRTNNNIDNLVLMSRSSHMWAHRLFQEQNLR